MRGGETVLPAEVSREFAFLTTYRQEIAAYASGTGNASAAVSDYLSNAAFVPSIDIPPAELQAAAEAAQMTEIYNATYNTYHGDISNPTDIRREELSAVEVMPSPETGGGSFSPINVEIHIHIEGNATPETVDSLHSYMDSPEFETRVMDVMERAAANARRGDWS